MRVKGVQANNGSNLFGLGCLRMSAGRLAMSASGMRVYRVEGFRGFGNCTAVPPQKEALAVEVEALCQLCRVKVPEDSGVAWCNTLCPTPPPPQTSEELDTPNLPYTLLGYSLTLKPLNNPKP